MSLKLLMGNEAIAMGALAAGVEVVTGYPGTPSTEVLETIAKHRPDGVYVEWSVNEKSALEIAAGAAYSGAKTLVTMKQVGLNVASDPLMSLAYIGVGGGAMVVLVADDPGPISSQTEQDTRRFAAFSRLPVFDPSTPEEAYEMMREAFDLSARHGTPVLFRPTTRVCHATASMDIPDVAPRAAVTHEFVKDQRWVVFPRTSYLNHVRLEKLMSALSDELSEYKRNFICGDGSATLGIACGGVSYAYLSELLTDASGVRLLRVATAHPFPEKLALRFLRGLDRVLTVEELDPVIEDALVHICGAHKLETVILGKRTGHMPYAGEYSFSMLQKALSGFLGTPNDGKTPEPTVPTPVRPPVLCAGCPHRASFYAVKKAMRGHRAVFTGDIGCYTLGNAKPLDMVDTCLCMGAGITVAQGIRRAEPGVHAFAFIGDSTFFHTGIPGVINAVYNRTPLTIVVLDNSTTAMTGHQPHPGTGKTMMGDVSSVVDIPKLLKACGVGRVETVNPFDQPLAQRAVCDAADFDGVSAIVFKSPCIVLEKPGVKCKINDNCVKCMRCIREIGCPALSYDGKTVTIDGSLCTGCNLCSEVCTAQAITRDDA